MLTRRNMETRECQDTGDGVSAFLSACTVVCRGGKTLALPPRQERDEADGEGAGKDANVYGSFKVSVKVGAPLSGVQL